MATQKVVNDAQKHQEKTIVAYKKVFESEEGKKVLHDLMRKHAVITGTFQENANLMYFKEGERAVVFGIMQMIGVDIQEFRDSYEEIVDPFKFGDAQ